METMLAVSRMPLVSAVEFFLDSERKFVKKMAQFVHGKGGMPRIVAYLKATLCTSVGVCVILFLFKQLERVLGLSQRFLNDLELVCWIPCAQLFVDRYFAPSAFVHPVRTRKKQFRDCV